MHAFRQLNLDVFFLYNNCEPFCYDCTCAHIKQVLTAVF